MDIIKKRERVSFICRCQFMSKEEIRFLEGPHSRFEELKFLFRVTLDLFRGLRALHFLNPCVTVFGSARFKEGHEYYESARQLSGEIARLGFTILTGGGPGIMEAANRGAREVNGHSVGCNILLPSEQKPNKYLDKWVTIRYFFVRKVLLVKYSFAFVVMPGGYGTLDEYFEALTLIQTKKISGFPVIVFGKSYHEKLIQHIESMKKNTTISEPDASLFLITDSISEAIAYIKNKSIETYGLLPHQKRRPFAWLFEYNSHNTNSEL